MKLTGDLKFDNVAKLWRTLRRRRQPWPAAVDLGAVGEADSSALALLVEFHVRAARRGRTLQITGTPPALNTLARLTGIDQLLDLQPREKRN